MAKPGHIKAIKAKGNYYFYVFRSFRDENKKATNKTVFTLGRKEKAIESLQLFLEDPAKVPEVLKGYEREQFLKWIEYVEEKER